MLTTFSLVGQQVIVLFILMLLGAISNRTKLINEATVKGMTELVLFFVTPCVIIQSFQREMNMALVRNLLITAGVAFFSFFLSILFANLLIKDKDDTKQVVLRFGAIFGNCGFMSLPIEQALLGADGVFYGAVYIGVFNVVVWTYGLAIMSGGKENITAKKLVLNPGIIGVLLGLLVFLLQIKLPNILETPVDFMAALNTPVPMIIIGYYLGNLRLHHLVENTKQYLSMFLKLVFVPALTVLFMWPLHLDPTVTLVVAIACSAPSAANTAMFSTKYNRDPQLGAQMVSVSTLFSLITIPTLVALTSLIS